MTHNESGGRHRIRKQRVTQKVALVGAVTVVVGFAANGMANAAPDQPGITTPEAPAEQAGITSTPSIPAEATPVEFTAPAQPEPEYWIPAPAQQVEYQALPNYDYDTNEYVVPEDYYIAPVQFEELHLPTAVEPTKPFIAPRDTLRIGELHIKQPNWVSDEDKNRTNNTFALVEAGVSTGWRSIGVETDRADRIAAAQVAAGAAGATVGAVTAGATAATVGALVGGTIGGLAGMTAGNVFLPGIGWVPVGIVGTAAGAGIGAAVAGVPAAMGGALVGGVLGVAAVTPLAAGDLGESTLVEVPDIDQPVLTEQTEQVVEQWNSNPVGSQVVSVMQETVEMTPVIDQQVRHFTATQPGGEQVLEQVDGALDTFFGESTPGLASHLMSDAVGAGLVPVSA